VRHADAIHTPQHVVQLARRSRDRSRSLPNLR
jgi:hypothetical protein